MSISSFFDGLRYVYFYNLPAADKRFDDSKNYPHVLTGDYLFVHRQSEFVGKRTETARYSPTEDRKIHISHLTKYRRTSRLNYLQSITFDGFQRGIEGITFKPDDNSVAQVHFFPHTSTSVRRVETSIRREKCCSTIRSLIYPVSAQHPRDSKVKSLLRLSGSTIRFGFCIKPQIWHEDGGGHAGFRFVQVELHTTVPGECHTLVGIHIPEDDRVSNLFIEQQVLLGEQIHYHNHKEAAIANDIIRREIYKAPSRPRSVSTVANEVEHDEEKGNLDMMLEAIADEDECSTEKGRTTFWAKLGVMFRSDEFDKVTFEKWVESGDKRIELLNIAKADEIIKIGVLNTLKRVTMFQDAQKYIPGVYHEWRMSVHPRIIKQVEADTFLMALNSKDDRREMGLVNNNFKPLYLDQFLHQVRNAEGPLHVGELLWRYPIWLQNEKAAATRRLRILEQAGSYASKRLSEMSEVLEALSLL